MECGSDEDSLTRQEVELGEALAKSIATGRRAMLASEGATARKWYEQAQEYIVELEQAKRATEKIREQLQLVRQQHTAAKRLKGDR